VGYRICHYVGQLEDPSKQPDSGAGIGQTLTKTNEMCILGARVEVTSLLREKVQSGDAAIRQGCSSFVKDTSQAGIPRDCLEQSGRSWPR
jgi:hypothetical protein